MENEKTVREYLAERDWSKEDGGLRPSIEYWPDEWAAWVSSHRKNRTDEYFCRTGFRASVFCPIGVQ